MIIVGLTGGLGNQLFQYALGRRLSLETGAELKLDTSAYEVTERQYRLNHFNIEETIATPREVARYSGIGRKGLLGRVERALRSRLHLHKRSVVKENGGAFQPEVLTRTGSIYLNGYWQSEKYFSSIGEKLREEYTIRDRPDEKNQAMGALIQGSQSVCLHVRRGDYVANPTYLKFHGVCPLAYYKTAVSMIADMVSDPHFFIFSDDPDWTRKNLKVMHPATFVIHNGEDKDFEDLRLMSYCRHHIIANSTFSWWGAWLSRNESKIVIAPRKWYNDPRKDASDLIPETWRRI